MSVSSIRAPNTRLFDPYLSESARQNARKASTFSSAKRRNKPVTLSRVGNWAGTNKGASEVDDVFDCLMDGMDGGPGSGPHKGGGNSAHERNESGRKQKELMATSMGQPANTYTRTVNTQAKSDHGSDPLGNGMHRMVPSGEVVNTEEMKRRRGIKDEKPAGRDSEEDIWDCMTGDWSR